MYKEKPRGYFEWVREDLITLIPQGAHKILDIGAASGNTGLALKEQGKAAEVVGVELCEVFAREASKKIDKVIIGDIEEMELPFSAGYFDYIICGDILEHLRDPWSTLGKLRKYLSDTGYIVASIPNTRHHRVIRDLVFRGEWKYQTEGILDRSHLRFFTKKGIYQLFDSAGFEIERVNFKFVLKREEILNSLTLGFFREFFSFQFLIVASKRS